MIVVNSICFILQKFKLFSFLTKQYFLGCINNQLYGMAVSDDVSSVDVTYCI